MSRQGKVRLSKWYTPQTTKEKTRTHRELSNLILARQQKLCNFLEWKNVKVIYKRCTRRSPGSTAITPPSPRYASLFFIIGVDDTDNELLGLEQIHHFVEILDRYFGNVSFLALPPSRVLFALLLPPCLLSPGLPPRLPEHS